MSASNLTQPIAVAPSAIESGWAAIATVIALILIGGMVGGYAAYLAEDRTSSELKDYEGPRKLRFIVLGLVASACVPLFLSLVRSDILGVIFTNARGEQLESYLVFEGLCLIAAFSARAFIGSISQRILQQVEQAEVHAEQANRNAEEAKETVLEVIDEQSAERVPQQESIRTTNATDIQPNPVSVTSSDYQPTLNEFERRALRALTKMTFRTATGVASDTGVSRNQIGEILDVLESKGLAVITQSPSTKGVRWRITDRGLEALRN